MATSSASRHLHTLQGTCIAAVLLVACGGVPPASEPPVVDVDGPAPVPLDPAASHEAARTLSLCQSELPWEPVTDEAVVDRSPSAAATERKSNAMACVGASASDVCRYRQGQAHNEEDLLLCYCPIPTSQASAEIEVDYPTAANEAWTRVDEGAVFFLWKGDAPPISFTVNGRFSSLEDLEVLSHDLDIDGVPEAIVSVAGNYNTIGRTYMHRVVVDIKRRHAVHLYAFAPEPVELGAIDTQAVCDADDCVDSLTESVRGVLVRDPTTAERCSILTFELSTDHNECGGCTAGGATSARYRNFAYDKALMVDVARGILWPANAPPADR